jgi:hypothetical protein
MGFPFPVASRLRVIGLRTPTYKGLNTGPVVTFHHDGKAERLIFARKISIIFP